MASAIGSGITPMLDVGMFLAIAWILIVPFHLFKTRGLKAFIPILAFIFVILCGAVAAAVVSTLPKLTPILASYVLSA